MKSIWMKKRLAAVVIAVSLLQLTACGETDSGADAGEGSSSSAAASDEEIAEGGSAAESSSAENAGEGGSSAKEGREAEGTEGEEPWVNPYTMPDSLKSEEDIVNARNYIWEEHLNQVRSDETRAAELEGQAMTFGEATMKYGFSVKGEPDENGYPLYIALHGGGGSDTPDLNDDQWQQMMTYYQTSVVNGIYVNPRGVRDTWDCHFNPESYPLYDRLIENLIAFYDVDPNRVYLMGFSAGGDGVYGITSKMADRFAAANMSAGHPNGLSLWNLYNMPLLIQVGELDDAYDRNVIDAQYGLLLDEYHETLGGGYEHAAYIHKDKGHNFSDNGDGNQRVIEDIAGWLETGESPVIEVDTNAVRFLEQYVRDPLPERVVWDFTQRADERQGASFYWLQADKRRKDGMIVASYDKETNSINVEQCSVSGKVTFLLNNDMLDLFAPITVNTPDGNSTEMTVTPDIDLLYETTEERGDYNYQFAAKITIDFREMEKTEE